MTSMQRGFKVNARFKDSSNKEEDGSQHFESCRGARLHTEQAYHMIAVGLFSREFDR